MSNVIRLVWINLRLAKAKSSGDGSKITVKFSLFFVLIKVLIKSVGDNGGYIWPGSETLNYVFPKARHLRDNAEE